METSDSSVKAEPKAEAVQLACASDAPAASSTEASSSSTAASDEASAPNAGTTYKGANNKPAIKFPADYLLSRLLPTLERVWKEPEAAPFHYPVNPDELGLPDYFNVVKRPMDLSTIRARLDEGQYANPQEFVDDMWLMFNNAWLYNKKTSKVYKYCTKLAEVFSGSIDPAMREMGYCCGQQYTFNPQVLFCYGNNMCCTIAKDGVYFLYSNADHVHARQEAQRFSLICLKTLII